MKEIPSAYNPKETEGAIYSIWEKSGVFTPKIKEGEEPYVIVIPPPNVTGALHMGHALNNTIQDILIRRSRMKGIPTLWLPGIDHAGIATQNVVEKALQKQGKSRQDLGREEFVKQVQEWVDEYGPIIIDQLKKMGCSCDWSRQRFTMDDDYIEAVKAAFKHYQDKGLIYEGERVINWCVRCQTALSDIEVEYQEQKGKLYYFKYAKDFPITIATTRPETKLGDTAVAVNPEDERYKKYLGQTFKVDFAGLKREIKIIANPSIDPRFGTGAVGITPAHSLADSEIAQKNDLEFITIIDQFGKMTKETGQFKGLKTKEAREKILDWLKTNNLLEKEEEITNNLSVCYRCDSELEPQLSKQWFLKMSELIKPAIEAIKNDEITLTPSRWKKVYLDWAKNIRDWCISRQIWWGQRLPVYQREEIRNPKSEILNKSQIQNSKNSNSLEFSASNLEFYVGDEPPPGFRQVDDVLDTWFSSALWPFATLGWPKETEDLKYFYPTSVLSTARDINMLWVMRMIFSGYEFRQQKPFKQVYVHPTVFNIEGKRMSKSLGTGVDPLELIEQYGADAVRFGLTYINTGTQDIKFDENAILAGKKFANKLWNIARFVLKQTEGTNLKIETSPPKPRSEIDKEILAKITAIIESTDKNLDQFRFGQAAHDLYDFVWHDLADVYLEKSKEQIVNPPMKKDTLQILLFSLRISLLLLHPIMPFITEEIWRTLFNQKLVKEKLLITAKWPGI